MRGRWFWLFAGVGLLGSVMTGGAVKDYVLRFREYRSLSRKLDQTRSRLTVKQARLTRAQSDDDFLELEARRRLGLVRAGEIEFRFVPGNPGEEEKIQRSEYKEVHRGTTD